MTTWFSVLVEIKCVVHDNNDPNPMYENTVFLFQAIDENEARKKAEVYCKKNSYNEYLNDEGKIVHWSFVKILEVQNTCEQKIFDGVEVFSRLFFKDNEEQ